MAVKITLYEECPDCGEPGFTITPRYKYIRSRACACRRAVPGPPDPPRTYRLDQVIVARKKSEYVGKEVSIRFRERYQRLTWLLRQNEDAHDGLMWLLMELRRNCPHGSLSISMDGDWYNCADCGDQKVKARGETQKGEVAGL